MQYVVEIAFYAIVSVSEKYQCSSMYASKGSWTLVVVLDVWGLNLPLKSGKQSSKMEDLHFPFRNYWNLQLHHDPKGSMLVIEDIYP